MNFHFFSPQTFFAETTYQKSILESKNKVFQKISGTKPKLKNVDFSPADELMNTANSRFQVSDLKHFITLDSLCGHFYVVCVKAILNIW